MASILGFLNRILPFATPGTPVIQDLLHLSALCALFYFGPQLQEHFTQWRARDQPIQPVSDEVQHPQANADVQPAIDIPGEVDQIQPQDADHGPILPQINGDGQDMHEEPGPAQPRPLHDQRNVGAKKAKALARKDQRRAYNEFLRSQGDAERARDAEGAQEREEGLAAERERRRAAEAGYEAKRAKERLERKQKEELSRQEDMRRRELAVDLVREELDARKCCDLFRVAQQISKDVDDEWIAQVLKGTGLLGRKGDSLTLVTQMGWAVRVSAEDMAAVYKAAMAGASQDGIVSSDTLAKLLDKHLRP